MKRQSFKYIFYLNLIFIAVCTVLTFFPKTTTAPTVKASITTPLMNGSYEEKKFCKNAGAAVVIDGKSGAVLYEKNSHVRLPMASTTKIMTCLTVLNYSDTDDIITVDEKSAGTEGSSIYLKSGEKISVNDLLYGLMLESGNDAAAALAAGCFGSEKECVDKMNELCHSLGLVDTHFDNAHGLDSEGHYTTAYELAKITAFALKNPSFRTIVSTKKYASTSEISRYFSNHNKLLRIYDGAIGVKTGYTSLSGRCLVSAAERDGELYIAVTLNDRNDWEDHIAMLDYAFDNHSSVQIADSTDFCIYRGLKKYFSEDDIYLTVTGETDELFLDYKFTFSKDDNVCEYFSSGTRLGFFGIVPEKTTKI